MSRFPFRFARGSRRALASHPAVAGFRPAAAAIAVAAAFGLQSAPVRAQPVGGQAIAGQASFASNGSNLVVTTQNAAGTSHSAINWQSFSVPAGSLTRFNQPSAVSTSINRVLGPDPSSIFGTLSSNGRLVLVNPAGIAVGKGAVVDTAGFTASTLAMSEADAIAGRQRFAGNGGALQVDGTIVARSGDVVLIAPTVQTGADALVQSANGATLLAAGQKVEITGRGLEGIRLEVQAPENKAVNLGTLQGDAVGIFAGTLKHSGLVQARAVTTDGGKVLLRAQGDTLVSGAIEASAANGQGGSIDVLGQRVGLLAGAALDASGAAGGGQVRVGGDYQGLNPDVQNAKRTYVDAQATIKADATQQGDGGRVIVWSDEATRMHGQISARGGAQGGNGGFAEVSGKQYLEFTGRADLRAPQGAMGTLLLDPNDIEINATGPTDTANGSGGDFSGGPASSVVKDSDLSAQLGLGNVQVTTANGSLGPLGGQITLQAGATVNWSSGSDLSLKANTGISLAGTISATDSLGAANGRLHLLTDTGSISQTGGSAITVGGLYAGAGQYGASLAADGGQVTLMGPNNVVNTLAGYAYGPGASFSFARKSDVANSGPLTIGTVDTAYGGGTGITANDGINPGLVSVSSNSGLEVNSSVAGSSIQLTAAAGNLNVNSANVTATQGSLGLSATAGNVGINGGSLQGAALSIESTTGNVSASESSLIANSGLLEVTANGNLSIDSSGSMSGTTVNLKATTGSIDLNGTSVYANGGRLDIAASQSVNVGLAGSLSLSGNGGATGGVRIAATTGDVNLASGVYVYSYHSPIDVTAGGGILGNASFYTNGMLEGSVHLTASNGPISFNNINSSGSYSGFPGGEVRLIAKGDISGSSIQASGGYNSNGDGGQGAVVDVKSETGNINLNSIQADGGGTGSSSVGAGGAGGAVTLLATGTGGTVTMGADIYARGGSSSQRSGGAGGSVTVTADSDIQMRYLYATAGSGTRSSVEDPAASGGAGGTVQLTSNNGNIALGQSGPSVGVAGGALVAGGYGNSLADGGLGGAITLSAPGGNVLVTNTLNADGGGSGSGAAGDALQASNAITVTAQKTITISNLQFNGGNDNTSLGGAGGKAVLNSSQDNVRLGSAYAGGRTGGTLQVVASGGGNIQIDGYVDVSGRSVSLSPGANGGTIILTASGTATVAGSLYAQGGSSDLAPGAGGNIIVTGGGDVQLDGVYANGGWYYSNNIRGDAGQIHLASSAGNVGATGTLDASGRVGGQISVIATEGSINVQRVDAGAQISTASGLGGAGGSILLQAPATSGGGMITATDLVADGGDTHDGAGGNGGTVHVQAGQQLTLSTASARGGNASLGSGGGGTGGSVLLSSGVSGMAVSGGINVNGGTGNPGGAGGIVQLSATTGSINVFNISDSGGSGNISGAAGGNGGVVVLNTAGDVVVGGAGLTYFGILADGGQGSEAAGGNGGSVVLTSTGGSVSVTDQYNAYGITASGGPGSPGGPGGGIAVSAASDLSLSGAHAAGGSGSSSAGGAHGGDGGSVFLQFGGTAPATLMADARGGQGGNGATANPGGGGGGSGGNIELVYTGGDWTIGSVALNASGGRGGDAFMGSDPASGGMGGNGGSVTVTASNGSLSLSGGSLSAGAGGGGVNSDDDTYGPAGTGLGMVTVRAYGDLDLSGIDLSLGAAGFTGLAGGNIDLWTPIVTRGGAVTLRAGDPAVAPAPSPTAALNVYAIIDTTDSGTAPAGAISLAATGSVLLDPNITGGPIAIAAPDVVILSDTAIDSSADLTITADTLTLDGTAHASGVVLIDALSPGRTIRLGGTDEIGSLNLTQSELDRISGGALFVGSTANTGPLIVESPVTVSSVAIPALRLLTGGLLQLDAPVTSDANGDAVVLAADSISVGAGGALSTPNGRWLTYIAGALGNSNFGTLVSGNNALWNRTYGGSPPGDVPESGNRYLFAFQPTVDIDATSTSKVYDGTPVSAASYTGTPLVDASAYGNVFLQDVLTGDVAMPVVSKNVGSYAITRGTLAAPAGYAFTFTDGTASITQRPLTVAVNAQNKVYDATTTAGTTVSDDHLTGDSLAVIVGSANFTDKNVGNGKTVNLAGIALTGADAGNYMLSSPPTSSTADITKRSLAVAVSAQNKVYDATTTAATTVSDDRLAGDSLAVVVGSANFIDKNVGTGKTVNLGGIALTGTDAGNYMVSSPPTSSSADISQRNLVLAVSAQNKVYDATTSATVTVSDDRLAGDSLAVGVGSANFADKNVGTGKTVSLAGVTLSGADAGNYALSSTPTGSADITQRSLVVAVAAQSREYDATTVAQTTVSDNRVAGDALSVTVGSANFADKNVGNGKAVSVAGLGLGGVDAGNYALAGTTASASANITPAPVTVAADNLAKAQGTVLAFNGTEFSASGLKGGETIASVSLASAGAPADAAVGAYAITPSAAVGANGFLAGNYIVSYLNGALAVGSPAEQQQVLNQVVTFSTLFIEQARAQDALDKRKTDIGKDDIVVTDTQCKAGG